ncbi:hypothetical protein [uncultured Moraxella sp.]|nr:hypothetical protein [uncultured Moraxella sp.]
MAITASITGLTRHPSCVRVMALKHLSLQKYLCGCNLSSAIWHYETGRAK